MTAEIIEKMNQRKLSKQSSTEYNYDLDRKIREDCIRAKEEWLNNQGDEIERLQNIDTRVICNKIKEITGTSKSKSSIAIKKNNGDEAVEMEEVKQRWEENTYKLFNDDREPFEVADDVGGPQIRNSEVEAAINCMKNGKALGEVGIAVEMTKATEELGVNAVTKLANRIAYMTQARYQMQCNGRLLLQYQRNPVQWSVINLEL